MTAIADLLKKTQAEPVEPAPEPVELAPPPSTQEDEPLREPPTDPDDIAALEAGHDRGSVLPFDPTQFGGAAAESLISERGKTRMLDDFSRPKGVGDAIRKGFANVPHEQEMAAAGLEAVLANLWGEDEEAHKKAVERRDMAVSQIDPAAYNGEFWEKNLGMTAGMVHHILGSSERGVYAGLGMGAAAAVAGNLIPGAVGLPEELATFPSGFGSGYKAGNFSYWWTQGAGTMYYLLTDKGVDKQTSAWLSLAGGSVWAGVEQMQWNAITKGLNNRLKTTAISAMARKFVSDPIRQTLKESVRRTIAHGARTVGVAGTNVLEEGLQGAIEAGVLEAGIAIEDELESAGLGEAGKHMAARFKEEALSSIVPMSLLIGIGKGPQNTRTVFRKMREATATAENGVSTFMSSDGSRITGMVSSVNEQARTVELQVEDPTAPNGMSKATISLDEWKQQPVEEEYTEADAEAESMGEGQRVSTLRPEVMTTEQIEREADIHENEMLDLIAMDEEVSREEEADNDLGRWGERITGPPVAAAPDATLAQRRQTRTNNAFTAIMNAVGAMEAKEWAKVKSVVKSFRGGVLDKVRSMTRPKAQEALQALLAEDADTTEVQTPLAALVDALGESRVKQLLGEDADTRADVPDTGDATSLLLGAAEEAGPQSTTDAKALVSDAKSVAEKRAILKRTYDTIAERQKQLQEHMRIRRKLVPTVANASQENDGAPDAMRGHALHRGAEFAEGLVERMVKTARQISNSDIPNSEKKRLLRGLTKGVEQIGARDDLTPDNVYDILDEMVPRAKDGGVTGVDVSAAEVLKALLTHESITDVFNTINAMRANRGRPAIKAPPDGRAYKRGLTNDDRLKVLSMMPKHLREKGLGEEALTEVMDQVDMRLPHDPGARQRVLKMIRQFANKRYITKKGDHIANMGGKNLWRRTMQRARKLASARYAFSTTAQELGDMLLGKMYVDLSKRDARAKNAVVNRFEAMVKSIGDNFLLGRDGKHSMKQRMAQAVENEKVRYALGHLEKNRELKLRLTFILNTNSLKGEVVMPFGDMNGKTLTGEQAIKQAWAEADEMTKDIGERHNIDFGKYYRNLVKSVATEFQGASAVNARINQVYAFGEWYRDGGKKKLDRLEATPEELELVLPFYWDSKAKTRKQVPVEEMVDLWEAYVSHRRPEQGVNALTVRLGQAKWGTREAYWMSDRQLSHLGIATPVTSLKVDVKTKKAGTQMPALPGEINPRLGTEFTPEMGEPLMTTVFRHMMALEGSAHTHFQSTELKQRLKKHYDDGALVDKLYRGLDATVDTVTGQGARKQPGAFTRAFMAVNNLFWNSYPLAITRVMWYSMRNMAFQGMPWGSMNTQAYPADIRQAWASVVKDRMTNPSARAIQSFEKRRQSDISQKRAIHHEMYMLQDPFSPEKRGLNILNVPEAMMHTGDFSGPTSGGGFWLMENLRKWQQDALTFSDEQNRFMVYTTMFRIGEKHLHNWATGASTLDEMYSRLQFDSMSPSEQMELMEEFDRLQVEAQENGVEMNTPDQVLDHFEPFLERFADIKNENVNFVYRTAGRSLLEQSSDDRPWLGLITYQRGTWERVWQNGIKTWVRAFDHWRESGEIDVDALNTGGRVLAMHLASHVFTGMLMQAFIGEKMKWDDDERRLKFQPTYGPISSMAWTPLSPGVATTKTIWDASADFIQSIWTEDSDKFQESVRAGGNLFLWMTGIGTDLATWAEAASNTAAMDNVDFWLQAVQGQFPEGSMEAEREWADTIKHFVFGTAEYGDLRGINDKILDELNADYLPIIDKHLLDKYREDSRYE